MRDKWGFLSSGGLSSWNSHSCFSSTWVINPPTCGSCRRGLTQMQLVPQPGVWEISASPTKFVFTFHFECFYIGDKWVQITGCLWSISDIFPLQAFVIKRNLAASFERASWNRRHDVHHHSLQHNTWQQRLSVHTYDQYEKQKQILKDSVCLTSQKGHMLHLSELLDGRGFEAVHTSVTSAQKAHCDPGHFTLLTPSSCSDVATVWTTSKHNMWFTVKEAGRHAACRCDPPIPMAI